jgi:hypothetical protein
MGSQGEPWLDAYGLLLQVDAQIEVVKALALENPHEKLDVDILRRIHPIILASHERYGQLVVLGTVLIDMIWEHWEQPGNEPTASVMWSSLQSLRASLRRIEEDEPRQNIFDSTTEGASRRGSAVQHLDYPPDESENRPGDDGDREYRTGFVNQHRRAAANRSRPLPW